MFIDLGKIIHRRQKAGFARVPAQAALICEQAKIAVQTLLKKDTSFLNFQFKHGDLYISTPHAFVPELSIYLPEIQKILDHRVGEGRVRTIKIRTI